MVRFSDRHGRYQWLELQPVGLRFLTLMQTEASLPTLVDAQRTDVEEAEQKQADEWHGYVVAAVYGDRHRGHEIEGEAELDVGRERFGGAIALRRPALEA